MHLDWPALIWQDWLQQPWVRRWGVAYKQAYMLHMPACVLDVCLYMWTNSSTAPGAVLDDGSSLLLSCADVATPQCGAHCSGCSRTTHTHCSPHTSSQRSQPEEFTVGDWSSGSVQRPTDQEKICHMSVCTTAFSTDLSSDWFTYPPSSMIMNLHSLTFARWRQSIIVTI